MPPVAVETPSRIAERRALGPPEVDRLARSLYRAKAEAYRRALLDLLRRYGERDRRRAQLSPELRERIRAEALDHARRIAAGHNRRLTERLGTLLRGETFPDPVALDRALKEWSAEEVRRRAGRIARLELATARLDATVGFFRENGVEPLFDLRASLRSSGPCPLCAGIIARNPHSTERALRIGYPHLGCLCDWVPRGVRAVRLRRGGMRPKLVSSGRSGGAGIVGSEPYLGRFPSSEAALAFLDAEAR